MQRIFHTPEGVRDIYNGECSQKRKGPGCNLPEKGTKDSRQVGSLKIL